MSKWSALTGGKISESAVKQEASKEWGLSSFLGLAIGILALVAVVAMIMKSNSKSNKPVTTIEPSLTVVQPKVVPEPVNTEANQEPTVEAKSLVEPVVIDRYFSSGEGPTDGPVLDHAEGLTFFDFQKAFQQGRQGPIQDRKESPDAGSLDNLRSAIQESGKTVTQYIEANGLQVSDSLLEALQQETFVQSRSFNNLENYDPETMIVAREALQEVPTHVSASMIVGILRDISNARSVALKDSIEIPDITQEQRRGLEYWATKPGQAGNLAKTILSRN